MLREERIRADVAVAQRNLFCEVAPLETLQQFPAPSEDTLFWRIEGIANSCSCAVHPPWHCSASQNPCRFCCRAMSLCGILLVSLKDVKLTSLLRSAASVHLKPTLQMMLSLHMVQTCHKQYKTAAELETHLSSYDHHHKKVCPHWIAICGFLICPCHRALDSEGTHERLLLPRKGAANGSPCITFLYAKCRATVPCSSPSASEKHGHTGFSYALMYCPGDAQRLMEMKADTAERTRQERGRREKRRAEKEAAKLQERCGHISSMRVMTSKVMGSQACRRMHACMLCAETFWRGGHVNGMRAVKARQVKKFHMELLLAYKR